MKASSYLKIIALFLSFLILSIPILAASEENRVYDSNGNLVSGDGYYREYNELNQLIRVRLGNLSTSPILEEYVWHPIEEKVLVKDVFSNGVLNYSIYYVNKNYIHIENSSGNYTEKYVYQDGTLVAQVTTDGQKQFIHNDHEGSVTLITDINGNVVENILYSAYGEILSGGTASRFDSEGKEFDSLTNRLDFHFRQIDPRIPVWDKPDTLIQNVYDPQSLNRYAFERQDPLGRIDPDGHNPYLAVGALIIVNGLLSAGYEAYTQYSITGSVYSWGRVGSAFGGGVFSGVLEGVGIALELSGHPVAIGGALGLQGYGIYSTYQMMEDAKNSAYAHLSQEQSQKCQNGVSSYECLQKQNEIKQENEQKETPPVSAVTKPQQSSQANNANSYNTNPPPSSTSSSQIFAPNIISSGGGGCRSCVTVRSQTDVRKIANQLAVDVYRNLTAKISKNKK